jgi:S1-C subfamily serine protease
MPSNDKALNCKTKTSILVAYPHTVMKYAPYLLTLALSLISPSFAAPVTVDDAAIIKSLLKGVGSLVDGGKAVSSKKLEHQLEQKKCKVELQKAATKSLENLYDQCSDSVVAIASVYKCGKCDKWHNSGAATAWVLSADGVMVTNYHVFNGKDVAGFGVRTRDGKVAPVVEILAGSKRDDVAIFKVAGSGFKPLSLGPDANVGSDLHIIAHPDSRFYTYTAGKVSRYYRKRVPKGDGPSIMAVTAEFARGSSGGPVMDSAGNVVGMVASTQSIYYPPKKKTDKKGPFQMVIRNCVPVSAIRALVDSE